MSNADALTHTIATARVAGAEGFRPFWAVEHHGMGAVSSSAPALLVSAPSQAVGDLDQVTARINEACAATGADEVLLVTQGGSLGAKLATLRALGPVARAATAREEKTGSVPLKLLLRARIDENVT